MSTLRERLDSWHATWQEEHDERVRLEEENKALTAQTERLAHALFEQTDLPVVGGFLARVIRYFLDANALPLGYRGLAHDALETWKINQVAARPHESSEG